jgi:hypothetical protein
MLILNGYRGGMWGTAQWKDKNGITQNFQDHWIDMNDPRATYYEKPKDRVVINPKPE